ELCGDGKIDPNDHRDPRWTPTLQQAAKVMRELTSLRALLPDVRACAEYCRNMIGPPLECPSRTIRCRLWHLPPAASSQPSVPTNAPSATSTAVTKCAAREVARRGRGFAARCGKGASDVPPMRQRLLREAPALGQLLLQRAVRPRRGDATGP